MSLHMLGAHSYYPHAPDTYVKACGGAVHSGKMAQSRLHSICDLTVALRNLIKSEDEIPAWCSDLIAVAYDKLVSVHGFIEPIASGEWDGKVEG